MIIIPIVNPPRTPAAGLALGRTLLDDFDFHGSSFLLSDPLLMNRSYSSPHLMWSSGTSTSHGRKTPGLVLLGFFFGSLARILSSSLSTCRFPPFERRQLTPTASCAIDTRADSKLLL